MRNLIPVLLIACLFSPNEVRAEYKITLTGNDLFALCSGTDIQTMKPHPTAEWQCLGYIQAVMDLWGKLRTFGAVKDDRFNVDFCLPTGGTRGNAVIKIVRDYLAGFPPHERTGDGGPAFILPALKAAYPCK
jgi:hypothetical protein